MTEAEQPKTEPQKMTPQIARAMYVASECRPLGELKSLWRKSGGDVDFKTWLLMRNTARKDLFWLGKYILRKDLTDCHTKPCKELFVQKSFDKVYHEGYTIGEVHTAIDRQNREKEMLWLDPRGAFKSTLDGIDAVQWLLNCPDIRILIITGEFKLAVAFLSEIKSYFYRPEKTDPSLLQQLFPEYTIRGKEGTSDNPLECPARIHINQKEPSLWVNAIVANLSGWHCDVKKMDDGVTDENSNTVDAREKLKRKIDGSANLLDEWGFADNIGTRYFPDDWYGERIKASKLEDGAPLRYLSRQCWTVKPEFEGTPLFEIKPHMVDLLFPEKLTFKSLRQKLSSNERVFRCQQLNEPAAENDTVVFTEDALRKQLVGEAPKDGDVYIAWDWSFSRNNYADYSAGIAARLVIAPDGTPSLYLVEIIFGRWKPSELAFHIVQFEKKWHPKGTLIEKSNGAELLQMEIARQAVRYEVALNILWKEVSNAPDAKRNNIKGVETLINNEQLWFCTGPWIDETFAQLLRFTGERKNRGRKDDIPDAIGFLQFFLPSTVNNKEILKLRRQQQHREEQSALYRRIFDSPAPRVFVPEKPSIRRQLFGSLAAK